MRLLQTARTRLKTQKETRPKRARRIVFYVLCALFLILAVNEITFRFQDSPVRSSGPNAIWLRHSWIDEGHSDTEYRALVDRLRSMKITDVYFHAGPLDARGTVDEARFLGSAELIRRIHKLDPRIRLMPWLGQVAEFGGGGPLDMRSPEVLSRIVDTSKRFLDLGADGIHIDIEPIYSGDADFLQLLRELHELTERRDALLSVAACKPEMVPGLGWLAGLFARNPGYWSREYFLDVSKEVDQTAVMAYDSGIPLPGLYGRMIAWEVKWCSKNGVENLYIGVPTYEEGGGAHITWAENLTVALHGLRLGVSALTPDKRETVGAAVFAEWTTDSSEERIFREFWLNESDEEASSE